MKKSSPSGFTLVELLTVMVIILLLAGIVLGTVGFAQKKAARSRALAEIQAMASACESYKADNGGYPRNSDTDRLDPNASGNAAAPSALTGNAYSKASMWLYGCLSGDYNGDGQVNNDDAKAAFGNSIGNSMVPTQYMTFKDDLLGRIDNTQPISGTYSPTNGTGAGNCVLYLSEPFGGVFGYSTYMNSTVTNDLTNSTSNASTSIKGNNPTFDLWSTAGTTSSGAANYKTVQQQWVKNW
jgi:prepilin-type N-terminal cleavage/methylation domain-containing protein